MPYHVVLADQSKYSLICAVPLYTAPWSPCLPKTLLAFGQGRGQMMYLKDHDISVKETGFFRVNAM